MSSPFEIIAQFLERFGDDVAGRSLEPIPLEVQTQLKELARGALHAEDRERIVGLLGEHPDWIPILVREVKSMRPGAAENQS